MVIQHEITIKKQSRTRFSFRIVYMDDLRKKITFSEATSAAFSLQKKVPVAEENGYFLFFNLLIP